MIICRRRTGRWLAALLLVSSLARAEIEFIGVLIMPERTSFVLTDDSTKPGTWRSLGQEFAGFTLEAYDAKADTLTLVAKGKEPLRLRLREAKVKSAGLEIAGTLTLGQNEKVEITRATLLFEQENIFPLKEGLLCRITPKRFPDGNLEYQAVFERIGPDGKIERLAAPRVMVLPASPFSIHIGDIELSFSPKTN